MNYPKPLLSCAILIMIGVVLCGYSQTPPTAQPSPQMSDMMTITHAVAVIMPAGGSSVQGTVTFEKVAGGMRVVANLSGLTPGQHGFHVHEYGDCSSTDATTAGGHFNPTHMSHGAPTDKTRHEGDMGNITAGPDGKAHLEWTDSMMSFTGAESIIGRSVIVHAGADDMKSQPAGNSGPRVACGVIGIAK